MKAVKMGIVSVSDHFRLRISNPVGKLDSVEVVAIASRDLNKAKAEAAYLGITRAYGSYDDLLNDDDIEAVYIPLPNHLHTEWVKKAADKGKHILCEKPFSLSAAETQEAIEYARNKKVLVMEAFMYKLHPQWRQAREIVKCGEIGDIHAVHVFFGYSLTDPDNIRNKLETGGGAIRDIGCYAVSSSRFITGLEPKRAVSLIKRDPAFQTDILSSAILEFENGARSVFTVATQTSPYQRIQVFGSAGTLEIEVPFNTYPDIPGKITVRTFVGTRMIETEVKDMYGIEFDEFCRAVRGEMELPIDPNDAVMNQKVLDALFESEQKGGWIDIA